MSSTRIKTLGKSLNWATDSYALLNLIPGTFNRYVSFLKFYKTLDAVKRKIEKLIKIYKLTEVYIFKNPREEFFVGIPLKAETEERELKIIKGTMLHSTFKKYKVNYLNFPLEYVTTIKSPYNYPVSKGHYHYFKKVIPDMQEPKDFVGRMSIPTVNKKRSE